MSRPPPASGVILAGGSSVRMGRDKAMLVLEGQALLDRTVYALAAVCDEVLVVGRPGREDSPAPATFVPDDTPSEGPLSGLSTALRRASFPDVLVVACDLPFLQPDVLCHLLAQLPHADAVVPRTAGTAHPLHAAYSRDILPVVEACLSAGGRSMRALIDRLDVRWVDDEELDALGDGRRSLHNVNDPVEWQAVLDGREVGS